MVDDDKIMFVVIAAAVVRQRFRKDDHSFTTARYAAPAYWHGIALTLQLDHIDEDCNDEAQPALALPNCHSQTDTYTGRNRRALPHDQMVHQTPFRSRLVNIIDFVPRPFRSVAHERDARRPLERPRQARR